MKKITLSILTLGLSLNLWAQNINEGKKLVKYERYSSAKNSLMNEQTEEGKYYLGLSQIGIGNLDAAKTTFNSIAGSDYGQAGLARIEFLQGNKAEGQRILDELIKGAKKKDYLKYKLAADAITYTKGGDLNKAIEWHRKSMEKGETPEGLVALGDAFLLKGDPLSNGDASRAFENAVAKDPNFSLAYSRLGLLMYQARSYDRALEYYEKAKNTDANNPLPYRDLANAYYWSGKYEMAKQNIEQYIQLSDETEEDIYQYVNVLFLTKDYPNALKKINEFTANKTDVKPYLYRLKSYSLYETDQINDAKKSMEEYFEKEKNTTKYIYEDFLYKGKILASLANIDTANKVAYLTEANAAFNTAQSMLRPEEDKFKFYTDVATAYQNAKEYDNAATWYGKIVNQKDDPSSLDYYYYGYYSYFAQKYDQAMGAWNTMYDKYPNDRFITEYWRGLTAAGLDPDAKTGIAVPYYNNWLALEVPEGKSRTDNQLKIVNQHLAYYYYNKKDAANATKHAKAILNVDPANEFAKQIIDFFK